MIHWTPYEFAVAVTLGAAGVLVVSMILLSLMAPLCTISDWLDRKLQEWWTGK